MDANAKETYITLMGKSGIFICLANYYFTILTEMEVNIPRNIVLLFDSWISVHNAYYHCKTFDK
jgi:hypothetical protein